ncbi:MAG: carbon storage regulator [Planctomycetaceae bacterium]|jgi:carbon storage regulator|nr:carbon storage regulator [Planctomycetaceae bacterium]
MLVLSRREGERIKIGNSVTVTIVRLGGDKVRIGIEAPSDVLILRGELEQNDDSCHHHEEVTSAEESVIPVPVSVLTSLTSVQTLVG